MRSSTLLDALECHSHVRLEGPVLYRATEDGFQFHVSAEKAASTAMHYIHALEMALLKHGVPLPAVPRA